MNSRGLKLRLTIMSFLEFAVWGAYLTSMGRYLIEVGLAEDIGWFYSVQGIVSLFMPALLGIVADRWVQAQRLLGLCHLMAGLFMARAAFYGMTNAGNVSFSTLFTLYTLSVAFYMPTLGLANSVAYSVLAGAGLDTVKSYPPIRVFGTVGFIITMISIDLLGLQNTYGQFFVSAGLSFVLAAYAFTLPQCATGGTGKGKSFVQMMGLDAFSLFKQRRMAIFFIFSMLLGVSLQITNGYANPYITQFADVAEYAGTFGVQHPNILISLSQMSETICILLIPFFLRRYGIKNVMLIAMVAWTLRFGLFGFGNPGDGLWMFVISMIVYGVAFDFYCVSGSLFVDKETDPSIRSSAQGLFMMMTNGLGAMIGTLGAQFVVNKYVYSPTQTDVIDGWRTSWFIFAGYALVVAVLFSIIFREKHTPAKHAE